ncbi:MAG: TonB-dependent receptor, partial [Deltaproteobacteria bacterium]|nr:TonB-dependent receptor [Deltaproteobacteria bacterium]
MPEPKMHAQSLIFLLAAALPLSHPALADDHGSAGAQTGDSVEEMVVWGVRTGSLPPIPGASTDLIFTDDYVGENKSLADLLSETEGVSVRRFGAAGDRSEVTIRGSSPSQVVVTLDGVRANSILTGGTDLSRVCLPLLDRVEVTRGAGSAREGSGAIGGVVNVVTRQPEGERTTRARFSGGSFDTYEGSLLHSNSLGNLDMSLGYCGFTTDGDFDFERPRYVIDGVPAPFEPDSATRINNDHEQHGATLALAHPLGPGTLRLSDYAVYASGGEPGTDSDNGETAGQSPDAHARDFSNLAQLRWDAPSPAGLGADLELLAYHRWERARFRDPELVLRDPIDVETKLSTLGLRAADGWKGRLFGARDHRHALALQLDFAHDVLRSNNQNSRERPRVGGSLNETLHLFRERLVLSAGARFDWTEDFDPELLPSFGLVISPAPWIRLRSHVERAYRAPNF